MAHIQDRGKNHDRRWQARYRAPDGRERSRTFRRKLDAQRWLDEQTADILTGRYVDPRAGRVTLSEFADAWLAAQTSDPLTVQTLRSRLETHIKPLLGTHELRMLRPSTIQAWVRGRQTEVAPSYCRLLLSNLSTILAAAVEDGHIPSNPCAASTVRPPKVDQRRIVPWTIDRVQHVIAGHPVEHRAMPVLGAGCGLRQGEVFGLEVDAVDFLRRVILVRLQVRLVGNQLVFAPPKGGREREVPLPDVVGLAIARSLESRPATSVTLPWKEPGGKPHTAALVWTNRDSGAISRAYYAHNAWKPALRTAGIEPGGGNGFHALRHHFASLLLDNGVSIRAVAE